MNDKENPNKQSNLSGDVEQSTSNLTPLVPRLHPPSVPLKKGETREFKKIQSLFPPRREVWREGF